MAIADESDGMLEGGDREGRRVTSMVAFSGGVLAQPGQPHPALG
jgi:hypothetical protein